MVPTESTSVTSNGRNTCQSQSLTGTEYSDKSTSWMPSLSPESHQLSGRERMAKLNWQEWYNERDYGPSPPPFK